MASGEVSLYAYNHLSESPHRKVGHHLW